jgi:hypothetical protein
MRIQYKPLPPGQVETPQQRRAGQFADLLDARLEAVIRQVEASEVYRLVFDPEADPRLVAAVVKNVLLEVYSYGAQVTEATFTAIGRLPKDRPDLMKPMILHDLEEVDHGEMALKDFIRLGGDARQARSRRPSPAAFAMAATCRMLAERENPFSYLGYMYLFESLTPVITERLQKVLTAKAFPVPARHFIDFHAAEDVSHACGLRNLIIRVVSEYPESAAAIEFGFDCFASVYPLPVWAAALDRARKEMRRQSTSATSCREVRAS